MQVWHAPTSLFAPLVLAVPPGTDWAGYTYTTYAIRDSMPVAEIPYTIRRPGRRRVQEIRQRRLLRFPTPDDSPYLATLRLVDILPGGQVLDDDGSALWEVAVLNLKDG